MNGLKALDLGNRKGVETTHSEFFTIHQGNHTIRFGAIRRERFRNTPDGMVITETTLITRKSSFPFRPRNGVDISQGTDRWRLALVQPGETSQYFELVLESETR